MDFVAVAQQHTEQSVMQKSVAVFATHYKTQTLKHIEGLPICILSLTDVRQYDIGGLFLGLAIHLDDKIVVTSIVTRGVGIVHQILLTLLVYLLDDLLGFLLANAPLAHDTIHAILHRGLDEYVQTIGIAIQSEEGRTASYDARLLNGDAI